jgi:hypothetical protein
VEEKIDRLVEQKRQLASKVVAAGEQWITELGTGELRDLFALSEGAVASGEEEGDSAAATAAGKRRKSRTGREARP